MNIGASTPPLQCLAFADRPTPRASLARRPAAARRIEGEPLGGSGAWLDQYREIWEASFRTRLDDLLCGSYSACPHRHAHADHDSARQVLCTVTFRKESSMPTTIERAQVTLPSEREVKVMRSFKAPKALVFKAYTEPPLVRRWMLGPPGWSMPVCEMDVRVGGKYRWRWRSDQDENEFGFSGTFREVVPAARLVHTEAYDPGTLGDAYPEKEAIVTITFTEQGGVATVTTLIDFGSKETRDAAMSTGMTDGMEQSYQLLDALLAESC
jgi:uncharacterized protein YndB with AHSA1/START domain